MVYTLKDWGLLREWCIVMNRPGGQWRRSRQRRGRKWVDNVRGERGWSKIRGGIGIGRERCRAGIGLIFILSCWPSTRSVEKAFESWGLTEMGIFVEMSGHRERPRILGIQQNASRRVAEKRTWNSDQRGITESHAKPMLTFDTRSSRTSHLEIFHSLSL